jgi:hypothetical protein
VSPSGKSQTIHLGGGTSLGMFFSSLRKPWALASLNWLAPVPVHVVVTTIGQPGSHSLVTAVERGLVAKLAP